MTDEFIDSTISNLKILGMIPKNGRLCVRKGNLALDNIVHGQFIMRWMFGDSRDATLQHVRNVITSAIKIAQHLMESPEQTWSSKWTLERILHEMGSCNIGLQNLKLTYSADSMIVAQLDTLCERFDAHQKELRKFMGTLGGSPPVRAGPLCQGRSEAAPQTARPQPGASGEQSSHRRPSQ